MEENIVTQHRDSESTRLWLRSLVAQLLNVDENDVATDQPLGEFGIDSLTAAEFSAEIEDQTGVIAPMEQFLGELTLEDIARELVARTTEPAAEPAAPAVDPAAPAAGPEEPAAGPAEVPAR